jgi:hypothetical protein
METVISYIGPPLHILIQPKYSLGKCLFLCKPRLLVCQIPLRRKAMLDMRVKKYLIWHFALLLEDIFCFAALIDGEDRISF